MKTYIKMAAVTMLMALSLTALADDTAFPRYIQKGDQGDDVKLLQIVLNSSSDTQVSESGSGSPGNETDSYGELTKQAVIKLQKKNSLGTQYGFFTIYSGALDDKTRAFLNKYVADNGGKDAFLKKKSDSGSDCDRSVDRTNSSALSKFTNPLSALSSASDKISALSQVLDPKNAANSSVQDKWDALNAVYKINASSSDGTPFIKSVTFSNGNDASGLPLFLPSMNFQNGEKVKITGCNFATSTSNTIHMTFSDEKATSTDGTTLEFTPSGGIQGMFDNQLTSIQDKIESTIPDPIRDTIKQQLRDKVLQGMQKFLGFPGSSDSSSSASNQMPGTPMTVTVENKQGVSNPYQLYFNFQ